MSERPEVDPTVALLLFAAATAGDPVERFIATLPPHVAADARNTIANRLEWESLTVRALTEENPIRAARYAGRIAELAASTAYRWAVLRKAVARWNAIQVDRFLVPR